MKLSSKTWTILLLAIVLLVIISGFAYFLNYSNTSFHTSSEQSKQIERYRDEKLGYEIQYPDTYELDKASNTANENETRSIISIKLKKEFVSASESLQNSMLTVVFNKGAEVKNEYLCSNHKETPNSITSNINGTDFNISEQKTTIENGDAITGKTYFANNENGCYWINLAVEQKVDKNSQVLSEEQMVEVNRFMSELETIVATFKVMTTNVVGANNNSLTDAMFVAATEDSQGKVVARGDINSDGFEDAIVQEVHCGASCSVSLQVVLNEQNKTAKLIKDKNYPDTFSPAFMASSAAKSEVTNISIKNGIISLTGKGLDCDPFNSKDPCTEEKWNIMKTVTYKFNGTDIVQLSVKTFPSQPSN